MDSGPEVTFLFQFGNLRDTQTVPQASLNLKSLKDMACDFINLKVFTRYFPKDLLNSLFLICWK